MLTNNSSDDLKIKLIDSSLINTDIGLQYFNHNKTLYLKILNSFTQRYEDLDLKILEEEELSRTLHTIKGLTLTLGMETISKNVKELEEGIDEIKLQKFNHYLHNTVKSIKLVI